MAAIETAEKKGSVPGRWLVFVAFVAVVIGIAFQVGRYVGYATGYDEGHATPEVQIVSGRCGPPEPPTTGDNPGSGSLEPQAHGCSSSHPNRPRRGKLERSSGVGGSVCAPCIIHVRADRVHSISYCIMHISLLH
ncbi:MAG: hypothetical protein WAQ22_00240 [Candidatus Saccharimonas sp.]